MLPLKTSKALTEKHIPLNDQQGPPVSKQRSHLPLTCPSSKLPLLGHSTALKETLTHAHGASFTTGQRGHPPRNCFGQYNRGRTPLYSQRPRAPPTPYSSDHMNLRRTEFTRLYARLYAAGPMLQLLLALGSGHGGGCLAAAAALPPVAVRPWKEGRGRGKAAGAWRGDFGCSSLSHVLISHHKTKLPTI